MPALILTGYPCVGKSTFASILAERARCKFDVNTVNVISEESACSDQTKSECYASSHSEKLSRSALKSEFDRYSGVGAADGSLSAMDNNSLVEMDRFKSLIILDSLNYIKGYRYELYCISKAAGDKHGVVWIRGPSEDCARRWNRKRVVKDNKDCPAGSEESEEMCRVQSYSDEIMDELIHRYEPPNDKNRWERPLYNVDVPDEQNEYNEHIHVHSLRDRADEILESFLLHSQPLKSGLSTFKAVTPNSNMLHEADNISQRVCTALQDAQRTALPGSQLPIKIGGTQCFVSLHRNVHLPELRRLRRQYIRWVKDHPPQDASEHGIASSFLAYIQSNV